jgi:histidinol-phosphate aminotransferase
VDRGVLIRETGPDGWLRVSIGTAEEMAAFKKALLETLHETTETTESTKELA